MDDTSILSLLENNKNLFCINTNYLERINKDGEKIEQKFLIPENYLKNTGVYFIDDLDKITVKTEKKLIPYNEYIDIETIEEKIREKRRLAEEEEKKIKEEEKRIKIEEERRIKIEEEERKKEREKVNMYNCFKTSLVFRYKLLKFIDNYQNFTANDISSMILDIVNENKDIDKDWIISTLKNVKKDNVNYEKVNKILENLKKSEVFKKSDLEMEKREFEEQEKKEIEEEIKEEKKEEKEIKEEKNNEIKEEKKEEVERRKEEIINKTITKEDIKKTLDTFINSNSQEECDKAIEIIINYIKIQKTECECNYNINKINKLIELSFEIMQVMTSSPSDNKLNTDLLKECVSVIISFCNSFDNAKPLENLVDIIFYLIAKNHDNKEFVNGCFGILEDIYNNEKVKGWYKFYEDFKENFEGFKKGFTEENKSKKEEIKEVKEEKIKEEKFTKKEEELYNRLCNINNGKSEEDLESFLEELKNSLGEDKLIYLIDKFTQAEKEIEQINGTNKKTNPLNK